MDKRKRRRLFLKVIFIFIVVFIIYSTVDLFVFLKTRDCEVEVREFSKLKLVSKKIKPFIKFRKPRNIYHNSPRIQTAGEYALKLQQVLSTDHPHQFIRKYVLFKNEEKINEFVTESPTRLCVFEDGNLISYAISFYHDRRPWYNQLQTYSILNHEGETIKTLEVNSTAEWIGIVQDGFFLITGCNPSVLPNTFLGDDKIMFYDSCGNLKFTIEGTNVFHFDNKAPYFVAAFFNKESKDYTLKIFDYTGKEHNSIVVTRYFPIHQDSEWMKFYFQEKEMINDLIKVGSIFKIAEMKFYFINLNTKEIKEFNVGSHRPYIIFYTEQKLIYFTRSFKSENNKFDKMIYIVNENGEYEGYLKIKNLKLKRNSKIVFQRIKKDNYILTINKRPRRIPIAVRIINPLFKIFFKKYICVYDQYQITLKYSN